MIIIPKLKLGYQYVPKIATTSMFEWLYVAHEGKIGSGGGLRGPKDSMRRFFMKGEGDVHAVENCASRIGVFGDFYRFAITRDPVRRFLSMYSNRVVYYRELSAGATSARRVQESGLRFDPQINELVSRLDEYLSASKDIHHHARPQMDFLGPDLSVFTRLADVGELDEVIGEIRTLWSRAGLEHVCERTPELPGRRQAWGPKLGLNVLDPTSFEKLLDYYRGDYESLPTVSLKRIKEEYAAARLLGPAEEVVFPPLELKPTEIRSSAQAPSLRWYARIEKEVCTSTEIVRINVPDDVVGGEPFTLTGAVVLKEGLAGRWRLFVENGGLEREAEWCLPSPVLKSRFPNSPKAGAARFRLSDVALSDGAPVSIWLGSPKGERLLLGTVSLVSRAS